MAVLLIGVSCYALVHLFMLTLEYGEVYPKYSSFRPDPVGTRAFYGALDALPGTDVNRHIRSLSHLGEGADTTLFILAANLSKDPEPIIEELETFIGEGARLVVSFYPYRTDPDERRKENEEGEGGGEEVSHEGGSFDSAEGDTEGEEKEEKDAFEVEMISIDERWGCAFAFEKLPRRDETHFGEVPAALQKSQAALPAELSWHSALYFAEADEAWTVLYACEDRPVLMERSFGAGTIVFCSDSYLFSNEAMREEPHAELLSWFVGSSHRIVFDESHLGIQEQRGVMTLALQYRLHGFIATLVILAILYVWKNTTSLVPRYGEDEGFGPTSTLGKGSYSGLVSLLHRSVPLKKLLPLMVQEWTRTQANKHVQDVALREQIESIAAQPGPLENYKKICRVLKERKVDRGSKS
jgi:hypothetical protein